MTTSPGGDRTAQNPDDLLLERLRGLAAQVDAPPDLVLESARSAFLLRRLDAELAELVLDSAADDGRLLAVRGDAAHDTVRLLSFRTERVSLEVQVTDGGGQRTLLGMVTGASGTVQVETDTGRAEVTIDEFGRFSVADVPPGTVRLHLVADDGTPVTTSWVTL